MNICFSPTGNKSRLVVFAALLVVWSTRGLVATEPTGQIEPPPWARQYKDGEKIHYHMKASNRGRTDTRVYEVDATGEVKKDTEGKFYEEFTWTHLLINKEAVVLSPSTTNFRQQLALPKVAQPADFMKIFVAMGKLGELDPALIGPVADLTTFYVDMLFCSQFGREVKVGEHRSIPMGGRPNSWADGNYIILGEDSIDFECSVKELDLLHQTATLLIKHLPPPVSQIKLPAEWMRARVADTANNWVEVRKNTHGTYTAAVGVETFDVEVKVSLADGRIISAQMDNPVEVLERECADAALTQAGDPVRYQIFRHIEIE